MNNYCNLLPTKSDDRGILRVGSIPVAILPSCQYMKINNCINMAIEGFFLLFFYSLLFILVRPWSTPVFMAVPVQRILHKFVCHHARNRSNGWVV